MIYVKHQSLCIIILSDNKGISDCNALFVTILLPQCTFCLPLYLLIGKIKSIAPYKSLVNSIKIFFLRIYCFRFINRSTGHVNISVAINYVHYIFNIIRAICNFVIYYIIMRSFKCLFNLERVRSFHLYSCNSISKIVFCHLSCSNCHLMSLFD